LSSDLIEAGLNEAAWLLLWGKRSGQRGGGGASASVDHRKEWISAGRRQQWISGNRVVMMFISRDRDDAANGGIVWRLASNIG
jgi:hypothetical protein